MNLRKIIKISAIVALSLSNLNANSSHIGYQGIAFDDGSALVEQNISLRFTIYQSNGSTVVYQETKTGIKTTDKGFFSHKIGSGVKSSSSPLWSNVSWNNNYKLKVEIDKNNGTSFVDLGAQDLISVAYAKKSENASSATKLKTPRTISLSGDLSGSVNFDGSSNITLSAQVANNSHYHAIGNITGLQSALDSKLSSSGNAASATKLQTARTINGKTFDGSADVHYIDPYINSDNTSNSAKYLTFSDNSTTGYKRIKTDETLKYNPYLNTLYATNFIGNLSGSATSLKTARNINNKTFNGTSSIVIEPYISAENTANSAKYLTFSDNSTSGYKRIKTDSNLYYNPHLNTLYASRFSGSLSGTATSANTLNGLTSSVAELNYVDGVTSNIQTQLNSKLSSSGNVASATKLQTARTINGKSFNGTANILVEPFITAENTTNANRYLTFSDNSSSGYKRIKTDANLQYNPNNNTLYANKFAGSFTGSLTGTATSANTLTGLTSTVSELNYVDGVTSNIQSQLNTKMPNRTISTSISSSSSSNLATEGAIKSYVDSKSSGGSYLSTSGGSVNGNLNVDSGTLYVNSSTDRVGIGTSYPIAPLHVTNQDVVSLSNYVYFVTPGGYSGSPILVTQSNTLGNWTSIVADQAIASKNGFFAYSDKRIKKDIKPIKNSLETIKKLRPVHYKKKDEIENGSRRNYGFIAQELEKVLPEAVNTGKGKVPVLKPFEKVDFEDGIIYTILVKNGDEIKEQKYTTKDQRPDGEIIVKSKEVDDFKTVTYDMVFTVAVDAIQEQQEEIKSLESKVNSMQLQIDAIKKSLSKKEITN